MENFVVNNSTNNNNDNTNENIFNTQLGGANNLFALPTFDLQRFEGEEGEEGGEESKYSFKYDETNSIATATSVDELALILNAEDTFSTVVLSGTITFSSTLTLNSSLENLKIVAGENATVGAGNDFFGAYLSFEPGSTYITFNNNEYATFSDTSSTSSGGNIGIKFDISGNVTGVFGLENNETFTIYTAEGKYLTYAMSEDEIQLTNESEFDNYYELSPEYNSDTVNVLELTTNTTPTWATLSVSCKLVELTVNVIPSVVVENFTLVALPSIPETSKLLSSDDFSSELMV